MPWHHENLWGAVLSADARRLVSSTGKSHSVWDVEGQFRVEAFETELWAPFARVSRDGERFILWSRQGVVYRSGHVRSPLALGKVFFPARPAPGGGAVAFSRTIRAATDAGERIDELVILPFDGTPPRIMELPPRFAGV